MSEVQLQKGMIIITKNDVGRLSPFTSVRQVLVDIVGPWLSVQ